MAIDIFLKLDGIEGESVDFKHPREINVESFSWGVQQVTNKGTGESVLPGLLPGRGARNPKALFQDFTFLHKIDKASPLLMLACAQGTQIPQGLVAIRKAGAKPVEFLKITLSNIYVTSVTLQSAADDFFPTESVTLRYGQIEVAYHPQKADGTLDAPITATCPVE